ncbi:class I SAM-dependent methyltransferase [Jatrophihabitans sp.]|uniref:class I SAM-dependent methyltransferase n=1 Tax=Jatrophihabitans sp. TaxID=1932789 RepID=UPI0030C69353|nr:ubiquinone/menaquinone biosynthesis methyltransferase [Jatrophihabitans sp.]
MPSVTAYKARTAYLDPAVVDGYEQYRFSGPRGRYVWRREQRGVGAMVALVGSARRILDCPTGNGRWLPVLRSLEPELIVQGDLSPAMLAASRARAVQPWAGVQAEAERLPFGDGVVDLVFCHALTKHLPQETQAAVLAEFARVSSAYVLCSFSVSQGLPGLLRRLRGEGLSRPVTQAWLEAAAAAAGLRVVDSIACTTPVGLERSVLFAKVGTAA